MTRNGPPIPARREPSGQFAAGFSGNPAGRPPGSPGSAGLAAYILGESQSLREVADFALRLLRGEPVTVRDPQDASKTVTVYPSLEDRRWACAWLADRAIGKAVQPLEHGGTPGPLAIYFVAVGGARPLDPKALR